MICSFLELAMWNFELFQLFSSDIDLYPSLRITVRQWDSTRLISWKKRLIVEYFSENEMSGYKNIDVPLTSRCSERGKIHGQIFLYYSYLNTQFLPPFVVFEILSPDNFKRFLGDLIPDPEFVYLVQDRLRETDIHE